MFERHWPALGARDRAWVAVVCLAILASLVVGTIFALQPDAWLAEHVVSDDAFFYFTLAKHSAQGFGLSMDGVNITNGFHPLWMLVVKAIFQLAPASPIAVTLIFSTILGGATLWLFTLLLRRLGIGWPWVAAAVVTLALNPWTLYQWPNGLETAASSLALVACLLVGLGAWLKQSLATRDLLVAAALGSLATLGRTDYAIIVFPLLLVLWWRCGASQGFSALVRGGLAMVAVGLVVQSPWLIWSWTHFHTFMQSSADAFSYTQHMLLQVPQGFGVGTWVKGVLLSASRTATIALVALRQPLLYLALIVVATIGLRHRLRSAAGQGRRELSFVLVVWLGVLLELGYHTVVRWGVRDWYFMPLLIVITLTIGYGGWHYMQQRPSWQRWLPCLTVALVCASLVQQLPSVHRLYQSQAGTYRTSLAADGMVDPSAKIGVFGGGISAYVARSSHRFVNLDGLVNNEARNALEQRRLWSYMQSQGIQFVLDYDRAIFYRYAWAYGDPDWRAHLDLLWSGEETPYGTMRLYRVSYPAS